MPCLGCTEPQFPFYDLAPGTVFKTAKIGVIPWEVPTGANHAKYMAHAVAARIAAPQWSKEDMFVVETSPNRGRTGGASLVALPSHHPHPTTHIPPLQ